MNDLNNSDVIRMAKEEFEKELFREKVEAYKKVLRTKISFWVRIFPWRIRIERRDGKVKYDRR